MILVNTPTAHLTVKAQVYITGTGGVAHAGWAGVLYRWDEKDVIEVNDKDVLFVPMIPNPSIMPYSFASAISDLFDPQHGCLKLLIVLLAVAHPLTP